MDRGDRRCGLGRNLWAARAVALVSRPWEPQNEPPSADVSDEQAEAWMAEEAARREKRNARFDRGVVSQPYPIPPGMPT